MAQTTNYYGKKYRLIMTSESRRKINVLAHSLMLYFLEDYEKPTKNVVLVIHEEYQKGKISHKLFVKIPYDKVIRKLL